jgi:hypothetical protein
MVDGRMGFVYMGCWFHILFFETAGFTFKYGAGLSGRVLVRYREAHLGEFVWANFDCGEPCADSM